MDDNKSVVRDASTKTLQTHELDDVDKGLLLTHYSSIWLTRRQWGTTDVCITVASMIIETWARCAKREVEHYYEHRRRKFEVASNRNNLCSSGSRKFIGKRVTVNDKIEN
ncbi:hypothetical protein E6C27_scaffold243G001050 [Cucumis melo var. makuwa]|uniref:Uncharacterized protein n=1 Tax=Cucumis melo var. makuwa TaxID=1194695 RepID=A0A5A7TWH6_CUCMM|nr:hypothetical protein E6C27_scaffold243G001050 [Cucumis melo var. makuwa]